MPDSVSLFHMLGLLKSDYAILNCILHFFALWRGAKEGTWHNVPSLNAPLDVDVLMVRAG